MIEIFEIDRLLTEQNSILRNEISKLSFSENFTFQLGDNVNQLLIDQISFMGIYLIEIKIDNKSISIQDWLNEFIINRWEIEEFKAFFVPNSRIGRVRKHNEKVDWLPLYIGKSKNISTRINEHLYKDRLEKSYSLKLNARKNLYGTTFRISTIRLEVENYDIIVPQLERFFRDKFNPILGRQ